jgi:hypothetical protein
VSGASSGGSHTSARFGRRPFNMATDEAHDPWIDGCSPVRRTEIVRVDGGVHRDDRRCPSGRLPPAANQPPMSRSISRLVPSQTDRRLWVLLSIFLVTRVVMAFLAGNPQVYTRSGLPVTPYVYQCREWGLQIVASGRTPYVGVPIEYPPGLLPFILLPAWLLHALNVAFLPSFVFLMAVVDALGLIGLLRLATRWGSMLGPWLWVIGLPLLGPMVLLRLDLVPAVATIWSLQRAAAGRWTTAGAFLGFGIVAKIYPAFLLPSGLFVAPTRRRYAMGVLVALFLVLLPFAGTMSALVKSVAGFHFHRGIQIESLWGNALLLANKLGYAAQVRRAFGSWEIAASVTPIIEVLSTALSLGVVIIFARWAWRAGCRGDVRFMAQIWFTTIACLLVTGRVLSPQFLIWIVALGAAAACASDGVGRRLPLFLVSAAVLTQIEFPFGFPGLVLADPGSIGVLTARNVCLIVVAGLATRHVVHASPLARRGHPAETPSSLALPSEAGQDRTG